MDHWTKLKISSIPDTKQIFQWRWTSSGVQKEDWNMSWQREKGKKSAKTRDQEETREQGCLTSSTELSLRKCRGVPQSPPIHTKHRLSMPPASSLFKRFNMEKLLFSPDICEFPFPTKKKKGKKEIQHSQHKENFWIFKSGITSLTVYLVYSLKEKDLWHRRKPNNSSICILYSQILQIK